MPAFFYHFAKPAAFLRIRGVDATTFLQGQFSNDIRPSQPRAAVYGLWLNAKGKVQGDSFVLRSGEEEWLLVSPHTPALELQRRFDAYIIADDVSVEPVEDQTLAIIFSEQLPIEELKPTLFNREFLLPKHEFEGVADGRLFRGIGSEFFWAGPSVSAPAMAERMDENGGVEVGEKEYLGWRIRHGIPAIPREFGPTDLPQEGGLERDAVSFSKGCYLGQEVMARLQAMGQVRRSLVMIRGNGGVPSLGAELIAGGKRVGEIRTSIAMDDAADEFVGLAIVQRSVVDAGAEVGVVGAPHLRNVSIEMVVR